MPLLVMFPKKSLYLIVQAHKRGQRKRGQVERAGKSRQRV